jgi:hypothetical protein
MKSEKGIHSTAVNYRKNSFNQSPDNLEILKIQHLRVVPRPDVLLFTRKQLHQ